MRPRRLRGISRGFPRLSPCGGQVPYVLLTRAPVAGGRVAAPPLPLDLHVLGLSLAFILSQDQTLRCLFFIFFFPFVPSIPRARGSRPSRPAWSSLGFLALLVSIPAAAPGGRSSAASFQCTIPDPQGRLAKLTTIPRFSKLPPHFFQRPGRRFPFAVAKVLPFPALFQIFRRLFFIFFYTVRARPCLSRPCT